MILRHFVHPRSRNRQTVLAVLPTVLLALALAPLGGAAAWAADDSDDDMASVLESRLEHLVALNLMESPSLDGSTFEVRADGTRVVVEGTVASEALRERALVEARRTRGVRAIDDRLRVDPQAVEARRSSDTTDETLAQRAAERLTRDVFTMAEARKTWAFGWEVDGYSWELDVEIDDGLARLEGEVPSSYDIVQAVRAVYEVPGIKAVRSELDTQMDEGLLEEPLFPIGTRGPYYPYDGRPGPYSPYRGDEPRDPGLQEGDVPPR